MNNFNFNNYNNPQMQQFNVTAENIISTLDTAVKDVLNGRNSNVMHIISTVENLAAQGLITIVGGGNNRVCIALNINHQNLKSLYQFYSDVIFMVPLKLPEGIKDNMREHYMWEQIRTSGEMTDEMTFLKNHVLPSVLIQNTTLLMQERVIRIEDYAPVQAYMTQKGYGKDLIGLAIKELILGSSQLYNQYSNLIRALDTYFVMADLNVEYSSFNFGIRRSGGKEYLTILDYGYTLWKTRPLLCPKCGKPMKYVIPGEPFLKDPSNKAIATHILTFGYYSCKNQMCTGTGRINGTEAYFEKDIDVFMKYADGKI